MWLNMFPHPDGVLEVLSPRAIVTGIQADFNTHCRVPIGAYCEVHDEPNPTNTETERTTTAIALGPTTNLQGSYYFMSLQTGQRISRRSWTEKPATPAVIERVHALANGENHALLVDDPFFFEWATNRPIIDIPQLADQPVPPVEGAVNDDAEDENEEENHIDGANGPQDENNNGNDDDEESGTASEKEEEEKEEEQEEQEEGQEEEEEEQEEEEREEEEKEEEEENDADDDEQNDAYEQGYDPPAEPSYVEMTWADHLFQDTPANPPPAPTPDARTMRANKRASKAKRRENTIIINLEENPTNEGAIDFKNEGATPTDINEINEGAVDCENEGVIESNPNNENPETANDVQLVQHNSI